jgi:hypothetical protein
MKRAIAFSFLLACSGVLLGDSPDSRSPSRESPSILQDLVRMTNGGFSDETILAYAKAHRVELPPEVTTDDLLWLRKSGVSETVIRYMAAIDVRASDAGAEEDVAYDSDVAAGYSAAADSYSDGDYGSYPDSYYDSYPESYYNDYYPVYAAGYYPYPVYFFVNHSGFFGRFHGRGHGFVGRRGHVIGHGGFGRPRSPRGDFDRGLGRRRGSVTAGHRGPGRPAFPRGSLGQGFRGPRGGAIRSGVPGHPASPRGGFGQGSSGTRGAVVRNGGFGRPGFPGGGHAGGSLGRGPTASSGGGRGAIGRPAGNGGRR